MGSIRFDAPPKGGEQLYNWLFRVSQDLNLALNSIDEQNMTPNAARALTAGGNASAVAEKEISTATATLKGLIVKNADIVREEMQRIEAELHGEYTALSGEFGEYKDDTDATLTALPGSITQSILNSQTITDLQGAVERILTEGYIKMGIIGHKTDLTPIIGIAIGQNVQTTGTETYGGVTYDVIKMDQALGVYTAEGLEFWQGGNKIAWLYQGKMHINDAMIDNTIIMGAWQWRNDGLGLTLKYVGAQNNV